MTRAVSLLAVLALSAGVAHAQPEAASASPQAASAYSIHLPAGASLISSPLDAGTGLARDAFVGLPRNYSEFFGWDGATQDFVDPTVARRGFGLGYWVFSPTPTTLTVVGSPYRVLRSVNKDVGPGWHLLGIPYSPGMAWSDVKIHVAGNPVGLRTAVEAGWIEPGLMTMKGSEWEIHPEGAPFEPGAAYWLRTNVPLTLRAEPGTVRTAQTAAVPRRTGFQPNGAAVPVGWVKEIAEGLGSLVDFGEAVSKGEGWASEGFEFLGATFGAAHYGLEVTTEQLMEELTVIDGKLDTLIADVEQISNQLAVLDSEIKVVQDMETLQLTVANAKLNADTWLLQFYLDPGKSNQSRNWARYMLAGCKDTTTSCDSLSNPVTTANYNAFNAAYVQKPGTDTPTGDFYYWWANSVLNNRFLAGGLSADGLLTQLYIGMVQQNQAYDNGIQAYMKLAFDASNCATDIASPSCDLYGEVYLPTEAYFLQLVGDQAQLAEAVVEAKGVMAEIDPKGYQDSITPYVASVQKYINQEAEAFLRAIEELALIRAADGAVDWNHFNTSDAGQALARADFVVSQLAGFSYQKSPASGYVNPPWPTEGTVGRIIYTSAEPQDPSGFYAIKDQTGANTLTSWYEDWNSKRSVTGDWPYFSYAVSSGTVVATSNRGWYVVRFKPIAAIADDPANGLAAGSYQVSGTAAMGLSPLVVAPYDSDYNNPPKSDTTVTFGSFTGLQGNLGHHGITNTLLAWTYSETENHTHSFNPSNWGAGYQMYSYPRSYTPSTTYSETGQWSGSLKVKFAVDPSYQRVVVRWPVSVGIGLGVIDEWGNGGSDCTSQADYYNQLYLSEGLYKSDGSTALSTGTVQTNKPCLKSGANPSDSSQAIFNSCSLSCNEPGCGWSLKSSPAAIDASTTYVLKVNYHDQIKVLGGKSRYCQYGWVGTGNMTIHIDAPNLSMSK